MLNVDKIPRNFSKVPDEPTKNLNSKPMYPHSIFFRQLNPNFLINTHVDCRCNTLYY